MSEFKSLSRKEQAFDSNSLEEQYMNVIVTIVFITGDDESFTI